MKNVKFDLQHEIMRVFGIQINEIKEFKKLESSNLVYSFLVNGEKYVIKK